jgi:Zn-dependent peptidase ImmA (M78 family)
MSHRRRPERTGEARFFAPLAEPAPYCRRAMGSTGHLLRECRESARLSVDDVAREAHVEAEGLRAFEEDRGVISAAAFDRVARVLAVDPLALRAGRVERRPTATLFFQQGAFADFRDTEDQPKVAAALERATDLLDVNALLGRGPGLRARFAPVRAIAEAARDGYRLATQVRAVIGNEVDPLPDMALLLEEQLDILVRTEELASGRVDALSVKDNERGAAAVILNAASGRRANPATARVDLAHELGHLLFDPADGRVNLVVDEEGREGRSITLAEQRARAFAAELLMPAEGLRRLLGRPQYVMGRAEAMAIVDRVRTEFRTPIEIAVNHLVHREYVWAEIREPLIEQARDRERPAAGARVPRDTLVGRPDVLERRVIEALARDIVTCERARELLGLSPWDDLPAGV